MKVCFSIIFTFNRYPWPVTEFMCTSLTLTEILGLVLIVLGLGCRDSSKVRSYIDFGSRSSDYGGLTRRPVAAFATDRMLWFETFLAVGIFSFSFQATIDIQTSIKVTLIATN